MTQESDTTAKSQRERSDELVDKVKALEQGVTDLKKRRKDGWFLEILSQ